MKQAWNKLAARIDARTLRERVFIFLSAALVLITLVNMLVLGPMNAEREYIARKVKEDEAQIARVRAQIQQKLNAAASDPNAQARARLQALKQQKEGLWRDLAEMQKGLVPPDRIPGLLESMLAEKRGLRLVSLRKLPVADLAAADAPEKETAGAGLYRHGVELTVQGGYLQMLEYLAALERLPEQLLWGSVTFNVDEYPTATMRVTVYTLSLDKQWLHI